MKKKMLHIRCDGDLMRLLDEAAKKLELEQPGRRATRADVVRIGLLDWISRQGLAMVLLCAVLAGCGGEYEGTSRHAHLMLGPSPACGLLPATMDVTIPSRGHHGGCVMTVAWEEGTLVIDDVCESPQRLVCTGELSIAGHCDWTADGSKWCGFSMDIQPR